MQWKCDKNGSDYYYIRIDAGEDKNEALSEWWLKLFELSESKNDWDTIIADLWIDNTGRIIGNIQNEDQAIGMDRGFRVAITFKDYVERLNKTDDEKQYNAELDIIWDECVLLLEQTIKNKKVNDKAKELYQVNPYKIFMAFQGLDFYGEILF